MHKLFSVAAGISRKMFKKMRFSIDAQQPTSKHFVFIMATRTYDFFRD